MKQLKRGMSILLAVLLALATVNSLAFAEASEAPFTQWNEDAPSLKALIEYVEAVTDEASPDFIPPADRIATFDMDGTLMGELFPTYLEVIMLTDRILRDETYQPDAEMLEFGRMSRDCAPDKSFPADYDYEFSFHQARAFAGMTLEEYATTNVASTNLTSILSDLNATNVYYVEGDQIYNAGTWSSTMSTTTFTLEGDTLTLSGQLGSEFNGDLVCKRAD
jgi:hypothetical protein